MCFNKIRYNVENTNIQVYFDENLPLTKPGLFRSSK